MHHHNHKGGGYAGMLWMMIPCLLLLGVLFLGGDNVASSGYLWPILIGAFVAAHIWMMLRGHGGYRDTHPGENPAAALEKHPKAKDEHTHGGCCH